MSWIYSISLVGRREEKGGEAYRVDGADHAIFDAGVDGGAVVEDGLNS